MIFLTVYGKGRKIGNAHIVAEDGFDIGESPGTGNDYSGIVGESGGFACVFAGEVEFGIDEFLHSFNGNKSVCGIEGIVNRGELHFAVFIGFGGPFGNAAGSEEEGSEIPGAGVHFERKVFLSFFAVFDKFFKAVYVRFGDYALIIVHEVAVIGSERISIKILAGSGGGDNARVVSFGDGSGSGSTEFCKRAGLDETCELVLCEAEDITAGFNVGDHLGSGIGFGNGLDSSVEFDSERVGGIEVINLSFGEIDSVLGDPYFYVVSAGEFCALGFIGRSRRIRRVAGAQSRDEHHGYEHDGN